MSRLACCRLCLLTLSAWLLTGAVALAGDAWVTYSNETSLRLPTGPNDPALSTNDPDEKDYAWGDVDQDGDVDLLVARKSPFTSIGRRPNVLFMNEGAADGQAINGVLIDRTSEYIPGFLDLTDDRDIVLVDVDNDSWLDVVTAPTYGGGLPDDIAQPRVYINQGEIAGEWQGFAFESGRILLSDHPNFCGVAAGDVTGDGYVDLYFVDYDNLSTNDFDDRLLINQGAANPGFFDDESTLRMSSNMLNSGFGIHTEMHDMNGDGWLDITKNENGPMETFNNAGNGFFDILDNTYGGAGYFHTVGFLDEQAPFTGATYDIMIADDGNDRWLRNTGNGGNGMADFTQFTLPAVTGGFGGNSLITDLNNDGWNDIIITDNDVDVPGCTRTTHILRNNGNPPNNTFTADAGEIPQSMRNGAHDVAVFDLNGDSWDDIIIGRCNTTEVWINAPPVSLAFSYPDGLPPGMLTPNADYPFTVELTPLGAALDPDSPMLHYSIAGAGFVEIPLVQDGGNLFTANLPGADCLDSIDFYVTASLDGGLNFRDPPAAPSITFSSIFAAGTSVSFEDHIEQDVSDWTIYNEGVDACTVLHGDWEQADPNITISGGNIASPEDDATVDGTMAFVTENGEPGKSAGTSDVDGGPVYLVSPVLDLDGTDGMISYMAWMFSTTGTHDQFITEVSNNGVDWIQVSNLLDTNGWQEQSFLVSNFVTPTATVQVRFSTSDCPNDSFTEAGVDDFIVERVDCALDTCVADIDNSGTVDAVDLALLLGEWGPGGGPVDLNNDGMVDAIDLAEVLGAWGPCL